MDIFLKLLHALWQQDYEMLANPSLVYAVYILLFIIIFLENGLLPTAFLPGDSLLILVGVLVAKDTMNFSITIIVLTIAASLGGWLSYIQGRWLGNTKIMKGWLAYLPIHYYERSCQLLYHHGLSALLLGRFLAFIRTLLPTIAGITGLSNTRFQFFNSVSGFLWVFILTSLGFVLGKMPIFIKYEDQIMFFLILLPIVLLVISLFGSLFFIWRKKHINVNHNKDKNL
ncbi:DedA family protein [Candidatus Fukatsuia anoeciicola]|uniref:DedA family protein n=1 Tax=Candidatus Fukatsuia anoeciicola TaxID=2994492 RepID=UPI003464CD59